MKTSYQGGGYSAADRQPVIRCPEGGDKAEKAGTTQDPLTASVGTATRLRSGPSSVAQWQSTRLITGRPQVRLLPEGRKATPTALEGEKCVYYCPLSPDRRLATGAVRRTSRTHPTVATAVRRSPSKEIEVATQPPRYCAECSAPNVLEASHCANCGAQLPG